MENRALLATEYDGNTTLVMPASTTSNDSSDSPKKPILVFHQCTQKDWEHGSCGRDSAKKIAKQGFTVVPVHLVSWNKDTDLEKSIFPYDKNGQKQDMYSSIMMSTKTCPLIKKTIDKLRQPDDESDDLRKWSDAEDLELPPGQDECKPRSDIVAVTEASTILPDYVDPELLRNVYESYPHRLLWAGFNNEHRSTGSKLLIGGPSDFALLETILKHMKIWRIDQQYKCFQNDYFTRVRGTKNILAGVRNNANASCDADAESGNMIGYEWIPKPSKNNRKKVQKIDWNPDHSEEEKRIAFIGSSLNNHEQCRGATLADDTVAVRMHSYLEWEDKNFCTIADILPKVEEHATHTQKAARRKASKKILKVRERAMQDQENKDTEALETIKAIKEYGEILPEQEILSDDTKTDSVLLHLENAGMMKNMTGGLVMAMCHRGLCLVKKEVAGQKDTTLSCAWHKGNAFKNMKEAIDHLQTYGYHEREEKEQKLADLGDAENSMVDCPENDETRKKQEQPEWSEAPQNQATPAGFSLQTAAEMISTDTRTDNDPVRIMKFTYAIGFMQKVAYTKKNEDHRLPAEWPPEVVDLRNYCERRSDCDQEFVETLKHIMKYKPTQWKEDNDRYIIELKNSLRGIWRKALKSSVLMQQQNIEDLTEWAESFNENFYNLQLPCRVLERNFDKPKPRLVFQAQGRLHGSRYKNVTKNKMTQDEELLHALENCSSG